MSRRPPPRFNPTKHDYIAFEGGVDSQTPPFKLRSGFARTAQNLEHDINGGYARIVGYERFDGRPAPSNAVYAILAANITGAWALGNTLTGATSGATGVIIGVPALSAYFVLTKVTGTYVIGENLQIGGTTRATASAAAVNNGASTPLLHAQYLNLAADSYRADILAVPGSGDILGIVMLNNIKYGFRNNAGGTACDVYKSSAGGWVLVTLGRELAFTSGGVTEITEGQTITGATSGATAVLTRVMLESGSWAAGTAAGKFIFASQTGVFVAENINVGASLNLATVAGNGTAITLLPGGRYEFEITNFGGTPNSRRIYGVDGINRGFEFDGTVFCPIKTGMSPDTPLHVAEHKKHLFYSFGGSAQHSGIGTPYSWTLLSGAAELAQGDTITGFVSQPGSEAGGALSIFSRNRISMLYGSSSANWNLTTYATEAGAVAYSLQLIGLTMLLDDRGLTTLQTTTAFGNFQSAILSQRLQDWVVSKRTKVLSSCVVRDKNQYRLFFNDNYALYVTMDGKKLRGMMQILFNDPVKCIWSGEMNDGSEAVYFGSSAGVVYQMEKGTSFDGDDIEWYVDLAFNHSRTPRMRKRYKHGMLEIQGDGYAHFFVSATIGYGKTEIGQMADRPTLRATFSPVFWDSFVWDAFVWDGQTLIPSEFGLEGTAENISLKLHGSSDYNAAITFSGALLDYSQRRRLR